MSFDYKVVLPPVGPVDSQYLREMFEDVRLYLQDIAAGSIVGTITAGSANRLAYYPASGNTVDDLPAITGNKALISDSNGLPIASSTTATEIGYVSGITSAIQTQIDTKGPKDASYLTLGTNVTLTNERVLTAGTGIQFTDGGAGSTLTISTDGIVSSVQGTINQISVNGTSGSPQTGDLTLTLPQDIDTDSDVTFGSTTAATTSASNIVSTSVGNTTSPSVQIYDSAPNATGFYRSFDALILQLHGTTVSSWDYTSGVFSAGIVNAHSLILEDAAGSHPNITISPPTGFTSYSLVLPSNDGSANQYLTTDGSGNLSWTNAAGTGTVNTGTANTLAYYASSTNAVSSLTAITGSKALASDSNGLPVASATTATELGYVSGVSGAIQTQIDGKASTALGNLASVAINTSLLPSSDNAIDLGSSSKDWRSLYLKTSLILQQTGVGTNAITIQAPSSVTSHTLTMPSAQGAASTLLQNDGSGGLSWVTVTNAGGATKALDNLASVAINTTLVSDTNNTDDLGTSSIRWKTGYLATSLDISATSNQVVLGTTRTVTLTAPTPATSSRTVTFPDLSADYSVVGTAGSQTITGAKTFASSALLLQEAGGSDVVTITVAALSTGRTYNLIDAGNGADFVLSAGTQTIGGSKTFSGAVDLTLASGNSFVVDSPTLVVDASNHLVGIGTTSPSSYNSAARNLVIVGGNTTGTTIKANSNQTCFIGFSDVVGTTLSGLIQYSHNTTAANETFLVRVGTVDVFQIDGSGHTLPISTTGTQNLGNATNYWNDISYKTITDRGCLPWCDDGVELRDGRVVSDLEALCQIQKHPTRKTPTGLPRLDYATFPKHSFKNVEEDPAYKIVERDKNGDAWALVEKTRLGDDGVTRTTSEKVKAEDGVEMTMLFGVMIGAFKEVSSRLDEMQKKIEQLEKK